MAEFFRPVRYFWFPLLLVAGFIGLGPQLPELSGTWLQLLPWLPGLLTLMIILLGWHFHCGRPALVTLLILLSAWWLRSESGSSLLLRDSLLALVPLNLALIGCYGERSLLSLATLWRLLIIALQAAAVVALTRYLPDPFSDWLNLQPPALELLPFALPWPFTVILCQLAALAILIYQQSTHQQLFDSYLLITAFLCCWLLFQPMSGLQQQILTTLMLLLWMTAVLIHSRNLAYLDELTGLPGRRALNLRLLTLGRGHTLAMLDIDHFKRFNDTHGHDVGDQVLRLVAAKLRQVKGGTAYRYGGEEFCIVFAGRRSDQAPEALEEIRRNVEAARLQLRSGQRPKNNAAGRKMRGNSQSGNRSVSVTISIGVARQQPDQDTIKEADKALYKAKKQGRNCICEG